MTKTVRQVAELLANNGWKFDRMKGDHRIYVKDGAKRPIVLPGKLGDDLATGTYMSILREAGINK